MKSNEFWKNKKVLVTGADGFIGSHLTEKLISLGAQVRAFVYYNSMGSLGWLEEEYKKNKSFEPFLGDIRDPTRVIQACEGQDFVFHLASLIAIPYSYVAPESYIDTNIRGALHIAQGCLKHHVKRILHTSTSEVYGTAQFVPITEEHPLQGQSPYSASKIGADKMIESFIASFQLPGTIVRPFNTYGPRQSSRAVIPTILSQLHHGKEKIMLGSLEPTRDFNFVMDTVDGFLKIAEHESTLGLTLNLGSGREISIGDLVQRLIETENFKAKIEQDPSRIRPDKSEVQRLLSDNQKVFQLTGWKPNHTLEEGLKITSS